MERVQRLILKTRTLFYKQVEDSLEPIKTGTPSFDSSASTVSLDTQSQHSRTLTPTSDDCEPSSKTDGASFPSIDCEIVREKILSLSSWSSDYKTYRSIPKPQFPIRVSDGEPPRSPIDLSRRWVEWTPGFCGPCEAEWKAEPDVVLIKPTIKSTLELLGVDGDKIEVAPLGEGDFNKAYTITAYDKESGSPVDYVLRLTLPINPYYKIECDVATTEFVRNFTTIPVPKIYAYDSSANNDIGLEWMLMEKAPGVPLADKWLDMDNERHVILAKQVAGWLDELLKIEAHQIGGLYLRWTTTNQEFFIGPSTFSVFYSDRRLLYNVNRGPFDSIHDLAAAALYVQQQELDDPLFLLSFRPEAKNSTSHDQCEAIQRNYPDFTDDDVKEYYERVELRFPGYDVHYTQNCVEALQKALPNICGMTIIRESDEPTNLTHHDISDENLLVDDNGSVTVLLDWENIQFIPIELVRMCPRFLSCNDFEENSNLFQNGFVADDSDYWYTLQLDVSEVIQTRLRPIFKEHLEELGSILVFCDEQDSLTGELLLRVLDMKWTGGDTLRWLKTQANTENDAEGSS